MLRLVILRVLESYFRHWWAYFVPIILMGAVGVLSVIGDKPVYIARGAIYTQKQSFLAALTAARDVGLLWITPAQATVNDIKELLQTDAFVRAAIQKTELEQELASNERPAEEIYNDVRSSVWVSTLGDNLLQIGSTAEKPELAQQLSNAVIEAYIQWKINSDREESTVAQAFFANLIKSYQGDLDTARTALNDYLDQHPPPVRGDRPEVEELEISALKSAVEFAGTRLKSALEKEENARLAIARVESDVRQKYLVVDAPNLPDSAENSRKDQIVGAAIFVVVGIVLSVVGVAGSALIDRSFRFTLDTRNRLELPLLAAIPQQRKAKPKKK